MFIFTKTFWNYSLERILKTFAQTVIGGIGAATFVPTTLESWQSIMVVAGMSALTSLLTAIVAYGSANGGNSTPLNTKAAEVPAPSASESMVPLFVQK